MDYSQEKHVNDDEDDYVNDTFESDCSDEAADEINGSHPSETGTYTVDKEEDDSPTSIQVNMSFVLIVHNITRDNWRKKEVNSAY